MQNLNKKTNSLNKTILKASMKKINLNLTYSTIKNFATINLKQNSILNNKKLLNNFNNQNRFNFVSDGANPKLKKKFYRKTDLSIIPITNNEEFLKVNELISLEVEEDLNNENDFKNDISNLLQDKNYENFSRSELQYEIFKVKLKNLDEQTQKNLTKNFEKLRTLFTGSLFHKKYYGVLLDNRKCKSMHLDELKIPTKKLALALAEEWQSQKDMVNLYKMHLVNKVLYS